MFVRIDDDRIDVVNPVECPPGVCIEFTGDVKIAAVSGVDMDSEFIFFAQVENTRERVDRTHACRTQGDDNGSDIAFRQQFLERIDIHPAVC